MGRLHCGAGAHPGYIDLRARRPASCFQCERCVPSHVLGDYKALNAIVLDRVHDVTSNARTASTLVNKAPAAREPQLIRGAGVGVLQRYGSRAEPSDRTLPGRKAANWHVLGVVA